MRQALELVVGQHKIVDAEQKEAVFWASLMVRGFVMAERKEPLSLDERNCKVDAEFRYRRELGVDAMRGVCRELRAHFGQEALHKCVVEWDREIARLHRARAEFADDF